MTNEDYHAITKSVSAIEGNIGLEATNNRAISRFLEISKEADRLHQERCSNEPSPDIAEKTEKIDAGIHPCEIFEEEVPHFRDNYFLRRKRLFSGGWENQEHFLRLYNENFRNHNQVAAESYLAAQFAFTFGKNTEIVAWEMEKLGFQTVFEENPKHRAYIFRVIEDVPYIYCEEIDLVTKYRVANGLLTQKKVTASELSSRLELSRSHVNKVLRVLETEGVAERVERERQNKSNWWKDNGVTKDYLNGLIESKKRLEE
ncbi:helix-turn-helix domain-containing protein [Halopenitus sp. H-Gu1]|uniref:helix-turn-helix domain-containing protein n=1 Tax=Halopenitus sp. H-Gu1 TaxID=3242697 RepID=UPI00359D2C3E